MNCLITNYSTKGEEFLSLVTEEFLGLHMNFNDIKVSQESATFMLDNSHIDHGKSSNEITGIILHNHALNSYYKDKSFSQGRRPDCYSNDGVIGTGTPGGICCNCPNNKNGSHGRGKACKQKRKLFIQRENDPLPITLIVNTGSLWVFSDYNLKKVVAKKLRLNQVESKLLLSKAITKDGIPYAKIEFQLCRELDNKEILSVKEISDYVKNMMDTSSYEEEEPYENYNLPF